MDQKLMEKLSNLSFLGYYDSSKGLVVVHFFNKDENKNDIIAYLKGNMSWDVREVISETSVLMDSYETITIKHELIGQYDKDSNFDKFVRKGLTKMAEENNPDLELEDVDKMFTIFKRNSYDN